VLNVVVSVAPRLSILLASLENLIWIKLTRSPTVTFRLPSADNAV